MLLTTSEVEYAITNHPAFNVLDVKLAFLPNIMKLTVIELAIINEKISSNIHSFTKLEDAIEYFFDLGLCSNTRFPICFKRESGELDICFGISEHFWKDESDIHPNNIEIVELLYENWTHDYDLKTGKKIEREPLTKTIQ